MLDIVCCKACHTGKGGTPKKEIEQQTEKYGEYICIECEKLFQSILDSYTEYTTSQFGRKEETLITHDTIYHFSGSKVKNPNNSMLGFGGAWCLVTKDYPSGVGRKTFVTNNLWHHRNIPKAFQASFKESGIANSSVQFVGKEGLQELKGILNGIEYLN